MLVLGPDVIVTTPDTISIRIDCWPPSAAERVAIPSRQHGSGDVNSTASSSVTVSSNVAGLLSLSPMSNTSDTEFAPLPFPSPKSPSILQSITRRSLPPLPLVGLTHAITCLCVFNAQSVGNKSKRIDIVKFILDENVNSMFLTEKWLKTHGDDSKHADLTPAADYCLKSHPQATSAG